MVMFYTVQDADTLPKIAEKFYGDRRCWQKIYDANDHVLILVPGVILFIPLHSNYKSNADYGAEKVKSKK